MLRMNEAQKNMLIEFVRDNASILFGFGSSFGSQSKRLSLWKEITNKLNDLSTPSQSKTVEQWKRAWLDLKKTIKKKVNKIKQVRDMSGSVELNKNYMLTENETIVATVCGMHDLDGCGDIEEFGGENGLIEEIKIEVDDTSLSSEFLFISSEDKPPPLPQSLATQNTSPQSDTQSLLPKLTAASSQPSLHQTGSSLSQRSPQPGSSQHQTSPQPESPKPTPNALRCRRRRERISEILGPYDKRYKESKGRSESVSVSSVFRQLEMQEETVDLLRQAVTLLTDVKKLLEQAVSSKLL